ncbi:MAG TPA: ACT domain-containing protein [Nocardioidaceae bacterium]|nr:ACT domain-containing protein [Nocardioidaceae bacterium]
MTLQAITVIGHDRPGIIAETTRILAGLGLNIEDSTMTLLRGHFAMMLICAGEAGSAEIEASLAPMTEDGSLNVSVREVPEEGEHEAVGSTYVLTVHGGDRAGIVSTVASEVARVGGNITDLTTRLSGELYVLVAEVDLPADCDVEGLQAALRRAGEDLGVGVSLRLMESDEL